MRKTAWLFWPFGLMCCLAALPARAADYPVPAQGEYLIRNFPFAAGGALAELKMQYRTLGRPSTDAAGRTVNAVLVLHGTTGSGTQFIRPEFAGELFGAGQLLDAATHFIIIVDNIGHGQSSKPSDGLRAQFPRYGYRDMVTAQHRLLTDGLGVNHLRLVIGILEREIARLPKGRAVVIPLSEQTRGHGSHTIAALWKHLLAELLAASGGGA